MASKEILYMCLAVGLTILGSIGNALGYTYQKKGYLQHIEKNDIREIEDEETQSILKNKTWILGFFVCLFGSILTAIAFKFGAQSVLAPLSALVLVCNAIFATKILGEPFTRQNAFGITLVIIGSVIAVIFGPKSSTAPTTLDYIESCWHNPVFLIFFGTLSLFWCIDYIFVKLLEKKNADSIQATHSIVFAPQFMMISYIGLAAYFGSVNVLFMKSFMIILGSFEPEYFANSLFYITIAGIVIVNVLLEMFRQRAIKFFDASYVVPIFQVMLILGAAMMGAIFFGEFAHLSRMEMTLFIIAIGITVVGVAVLAFQVGAIYKNMLKKIEELGSTIGLEFEQKQMSIRTRARISFSKKSKRMQKLKIEIPNYPAFFGMDAAVGYARECKNWEHTHKANFAMVLDDIKLQKIIPSISKDPKDSPYRKMESPKGILSNGFPDTPSEPFEGILIDSAHGHVSNNSGEEHKQTRNKSRHYNQVSMSESSTNGGGMGMGGVEALRIQSTSLSPESMPLGTVDEH